MQRRIEPRNTRRSGGTSTRGLSSSRVRSTTLRVAKPKSKTSAKAKGSAAKASRTAKAGKTVKASRTVKAAKASVSKPSRRGSRLSGQTTTDHGTIQKWAEERQGKPATVASTRSRSSAGILRIDFPGFKGKGTLQEVSWDEWFKTFDERKLAFIYQDRAATGQPSRFFKLINRTGSAKRKK